MTTPTAIVCFALALLLAGTMFVITLHELCAWAYKNGYSRGKADTEKWITEQRSQVDQVRAEIWREK